ncbi:MAG: transglutaminase domain-containing protein, partial [Pseudomonadota bacterium]
MSAVVRAQTASSIVSLPKFWTGLALVIWGALSDNLAGGVVMALLIEALSLTKVRWDLGAREFHRAADLTRIIFALAAVMQFSRHSVHGIYEILLVAPFCFFPLVLVQRGSTHGKTPLSSLFYSLRRLEFEDQRFVDLEPFYICMCIVAASTTDAGGAVYIALASFLICGLLLAIPLNRYRLVHRFLVLLLAAELGFFAYLTMIHTHRQLENSFIYWLNQFPWSGGDPNRAITAIGSIGRLKLSDQIRIRVTPTVDLEVPLVLHEANFDTFRLGIWTATEAAFETIDQEQNATKWPVGKQSTTDARTLEIAFEHRHELAYLPIPRGVDQIDSEQIVEVQRNDHGTLMSESPPGATEFTARFTDRRDDFSAPRDEDLIIPQNYQSVIADVTAEVGAHGSLMSQAQQVEQFFHENFRYSLVQDGFYPGRTPLGHFLRSKRRGHCEYFASAATLMLRELGIPARYAVGYVVDEYSALENRYLARARHAHAWTIAYIDGEWHHIDPTPSIWYGLEADLVSRWQSLQDFTSWLWYHYRRFSLSDLEEYSDLMIFMVPPLALLLFLRLRKSPLARARDETKRKAGG